MRRNKGGFFPLDDAGPVSEWERNESFCSSIVLVRMSEQKGWGWVYCIYGRLGGGISGVMWDIF
jgi:hypothetical protein